MHIAGRHRRLPWIIVSLLGAMLISMSGCAQLGGGKDSSGSSSGGTMSSNEPYYPTDFKDILIPAELDWNLDKSMAINTASFAGGILNFSGRVEINSLTEFFIASMRKDGWKLAGTVKSKYVLLAFTKPDKTSLIRIHENEFGLKTEVSIYVTDMTKSSSSAVNTFR